MCWSQKPGWKKFLAYVGPGFLVSLAYLDPGNSNSLTLDYTYMWFPPTLYHVYLYLCELSGSLPFTHAVETDLQAGADHKYEVYDNKLHELWMKKR